MGIVTQHQTCPQCPMGDVSASRPSDSTILAGDPRATAGYQFVDDLE